MKNKNIIRTSIFVGILFLSNVPEITKADTYEYYAFTAQPFVAKRESLKANGYSCVGAGSGVTCTKTFWYTYLSSYAAYHNDHRTLTGYANYANGAYLSTVRVDFYNSPFLYIKNPPEGNISISINSTLNKYDPKPSFNQESGWLVNSKDGTLSANGEEQKHLFYELKTNKITLSRNGKNFSSKEEIIDYLNDSDFLTKLGFSETEKNNSLEYFIPKLQESKEQNYYLTILSDEAIEEISELHIDPQPKNIIREYFAVYPTPVPVKTEGDIVFPQNQNTDGFTAKETGEFLIQKPMQVFFE